MATTIKQKTTPLSTSGANGGARSDVNEATADVTAQMTALRDDFANLAKAVSVLAGAGAGAAVDEASARAEAVGGAGKAVAKSAADTIAERGEMIIDYAQRKPLAALAVAAGVGLLVGYATAPRK